MGSEPLIQQLDCAEDHKLTTTTIIVQLQGDATKNSSTTTTTETPSTKPTSAKTKGESTNSETSNSSSSSINSNGTFSNLCILTPGFIVQRVTHVLIPFYQQGLAVLFSIFCLMLRKCHLQLAELFTRRSSANSLNHERLEEIRLLHQQLCAIGSIHLSTYFGLSCLCICCTSVAIWTCGIYTIIINEYNLVPNSEVVMIVKLLYFLRYFLMYFAVLSSGLILISGQLLANSASALVDALNSSSLTPLDSKAQFQVSLILHKTKTIQKGNVTAGNITSIGTVFLTSAVVNATTYLLVLLQFRLGIQFASSGTQTTNNTAIQQL